MDVYEVFVWDANTDSHVPVPSGSVPVPGGLPGLSPASIAQVEAQRTYSTVELLQNPPAPLMNNQIGMIENVPDPNWIADSVQEVLGDPITSPPVVHQENPPSPKPDRKPHTTHLIGLAIKNSLNGSLTVDQICYFIRKYFSLKKFGRKDFKVIVETDLTQNSRDWFKKMPTGQWTIVPTRAAEIDREQLEFASDFQNWMPNPGNLPNLIRGDVKGLPDLPPTWNYKGISSIQMIALALKNSPSGVASVPEIRDFMEQHFHLSRTGDKATDYIRTRVSDNAFFTKIKDPFRKVRFTMKTELQAAMDADIQESIHKDEQFIRKEQLKNPDDLAALVEGKYKDKVVIQQPVPKTMKVTTMWSLNPERIEQLNTNVQAISKTYGKEIRQSMRRPEDLEAILSGDLKHPKVDRQANDENLQQTPEIRYKKPALTVVQLVYLALKNSHTGRLYMAEIYDFLETNFPFFNRAFCIKSNLTSLVGRSDCFLKRSGPEAEDYCGPRLPEVSLSHLSALAMMNQENKTLTVAEVFEFIRKHLPKRATTEKSIRTNLSYSPWFFQLTSSRPPNWMIVNEFLPKIESQLRARAPRIQMLMDKPDNLAKMLLGQFFESDHLNIHEEIVDDAEVEDELLLDDPLQFLDPFEDYADIIPSEESNSAECETEQRNDSFTFAQKERLRMIRKRRQHEEVVSNQPVVKLVKLSRREIKRIQEEIRNK